MQKKIITLTVDTDREVVIIKKDYIAESKKARKEMILKLIIAFLISVLAITSLTVMNETKAEQIDNTSDNEEFVDLALQTTEFDNMEEFIIPALNQLRLVEETPIPEASEVHSAKFTVTAYCSCEKCCGKWALDRKGPVVGAAGVPLIPDVSVAVDNSIFPFGTVFTDPQGHEFIAADTGSGVEGYWIDIYMDDHEVAKAWGKQEVTLTW